MDIHKYKKYKNKYMLLKKQFGGIPSPRDKVSYSTNLIDYVPGRQYQLSAVQLAHDHYNSEHKLQPFIYNTDDIKFKLLPIDANNKKFIMLKEDNSWAYLTYLQPKYELRTALEIMRGSYIVSDDTTIPIGAQYYYDLEENKIYIGKRANYLPAFTANYCLEQYY
jgi:hypothetical protein